MVRANLFPKEVCMLEKTIISNLLFNEEFSRKVFPYIKDEYFDENTHKKIFSTYSEYVEKYKEPPSIEALKISIDKRKDLNEDAYKEVCKSIDELSIDATTNQEWLLHETEKFCQDKDLYNSIRKAILILDGQDKDYDKGALPKLLSDSLGISFDTSVGHDFLEDFEDRYEYYHRKEERLSFDIDIFNKITKGGIPRKSMTVLLATTGGGKSLVKCHMAATSLMFGRSVLYITMELPEEEVARRIDANLLDTRLDELMALPRDTYNSRVNKVKSKTPGKLIIKEYPTGSAHAGHFRHLLNELRMKKNFIPDIIFVDYLNICASSRVKGAASANSYTLVKSIAEEVRGLAMEFGVAIVTSSQFNRSAYDSSDVDLSNTSESMGITHTADAIFGLISNEELEERKQLMIKQLKNRWGDLSYYKRFMVGIDRAKMKIFDLEEEVQTKVQSESRNVKDDDKPVFDKGSFNEEWADVSSKRKKKLKEAEDIL
jgi:KaiC/GvpD/RAD55 family RecA-like ATPase